jgi:transposase-like protein
MARFSNEFKEALISKVLSNPNQSLRSFATEAQVAVSTLHEWVHSAKRSNDNDDSLAKANMNRPPANWSLSEKLQAIIDTATLSDEALNHYCRQQGLYKSQLDQWKLSFLSTHDLSTKKTADELKSLRMQNKQLERELQRKDKALAEASALLLLKKNLDRLWMENEED